MHRVWGLRRRSSSLILEAPKRQNFSINFGRGYPKNIQHVEMAILPLTHSPPHLISSHVLLTFWNKRPKLAISLNIGLPGKVCSLRAAPITMEGSSSSGSSDRYWGGDAFSIFQNAQKSVSILQRHHQHHHRARHDLRPHITHTPWCARALSGRRCQGFCLASILHSLALGE